MEGNTEATPRTSQSDSHSVSSMYARTPCIHELRMIVCSHKHSLKQKEPFLSLLSDLKRIRRFFCPSLCLETPPLHYVAKAR
mmetsp:Transcript_13102/g.25712  ORF Transcript_13102/g.25712 Transcript_13102/m.25712 type:complete len:82 (+) Transcript_13102:334-579(+)